MCQTAAVEWLQLRQLFAGCEETAGTKQVSNAWVIEDW